MSARECECPEFRSGVPCGHAAKWLVRVGTRKSDAQFSCSHHLSRTCDITLRAEVMLADRTVSLTVTAVTS